MNLPLISGFIGFHGITKIIGFIKNTTTKKFTLVCVILTIPQPVWKCEGPGIELRSVPSCLSSEVLVSAVLAVVLVCVVARGQ